MPSTLSSIWERAVDGSRSSSGKVYFSLTVFGALWVALGVPTLNESSVGVDAIGGFILGLVITLFADAMFAWKKGKSDSIAEYVMLISVVAGSLTVLATIKRFVSPGFFAYVLIFCSGSLFLIGWFALYAVDPKLPNPSINNPATPEGLA